MLKSFSPIPGAYQLINREFVRYALEKYPVNTSREDDSETKDCVRQN